MLDKKRQEIPVATRRNPIFVTCVGRMEESAEEGFSVTQEDFPFFRESQAQAGEGGLCKSLQVS